VTKKSARDESYLWPYLIADL